MYFKLIKFILMRTPWDWEINKAKQFVRVYTSCGGFYIDLTKVSRLKAVHILLKYYWYFHYPRASTYLYILWYHKIYKLLYPKTYKLKETIKISSDLLLLNYKYKDIAQDMVDSAIEGQKNYAQN